jgi:hypothetical protein
MQGQAPMMFMLTQGMLVTLDSKSCERLLALLL